MRKRDIYDEESADTCPHETLRRAYLKNEYTIKVVDFCARCGKGIKDVSEKKIKDFVPYVEVKVEKIPTNIKLF